MSDKNRHQSDNRQEAGSQEETFVELETDDTAAEGVPSPENGTASKEPETIEKRLSETEAALEKEKKEYLFLMADFDNYRKRVVKEKADLIKNAAEKVLNGLLPIVDDFERGLDATKDSPDVSPVREGMELIYSKLMRFLKENGVKVMETDGAGFDAEYHEAIATVPAPDESLKGKIIDTTTKGYTLNDKVLRHAKVVVGE